MRREQREPQHARDLGRVDLLGRSEFGDGAEPPALQHPPLSEGPRQRRNALLKRGACHAE
jgi:hypothetical protein